MTDDAQVPHVGLSSLPPSILGDIWSDITGKVTEKATESLNKVISDELGETGGAILGPVVEKGMAALVSALGLNVGQSESDLDKVMGELAKIKDTLAEMKGELRKIEAAVKAVGELVTREAERIMQGAKYRDYLDARRSIDAMWTTTWSLLFGIVADPTNREAVAGARALYANQTVNFIKETLAATAKIRDSVLQVFGDKQSLVLYMANETQADLRKAIWHDVAAGINADGFTLLQKKKPELWQALLNGPCGDVLRDLKSFSGNGPDGRTGAMQRFWYGESWIIFMETAHAAIARQIPKAPLTIFLSEINVAVSRALIILTIIYGKNAGLLTSANAVIQTQREVAAEANVRYADFMRSLVEWIGGVGNWGISPVGKRPGADRTRLFGIWAANWMDTSTDLFYPCTIAKDDQGRTYPCSLWANFPNVRAVAEYVWRRANAMNFVYEKTGPHAFGWRAQGWAKLGKPLEEWSRDYIDRRLPMLPEQQALPSA